MKAASLFVFPFLKKYCDTGQKAEVLINMPGCVCVRVCVCFGGMLVMAEREREDSIRQGMG